MSFDPVEALHAGEKLELVLRDDDTQTSSKLRRPSMLASNWRPYAILGIGALATKRRIPEESSPINFTPQAGLGVAFNYRNSVEFYVDYRLHHISAGRRTAAGNPGIHSSYLQFSASVVRW